MTRNDGGFTLLELLAALTVLGVLMVLMFGGLRFGARVWERGEGDLRAMVEMQAVTSLIRRQVSQAMPSSAATAAGADETAGAGGVGAAGGLAGLGRSAGVNGMFGDGRDAALAPFRGTSDAFRLLGPPPSQLLPGGVYETIIGLEDGIGGTGGGRRLVAWWRPLFSTSAGDSSPSINADVRTRQVVLMNGIADLRVSYFGQSEDVTEPPRWHDRWDSTLALPTLVSVQMAFMPGDRRSWPQLIVAPIATPAY